MPERDIESLGVMGWGVGWGWEILPPPPPSSSSPPGGVSKSQNQVGVIEHRLKSV